MDNNKLQARLTIDEGLRLKPYVDTTGHITIGVGRNLTDRGVTMSTVSQMLDEDIASSIAECSKYAWFESLDDPRKMVLVCMMFNLGPTKFAGFADMIVHIKEGRYADASADMLNSIWAHQVGHRANVYAEIMRTGLWPE